MDSKDAKKQSSNIFAEPSTLASESLAFLDGWIDENSQLKASAGHISLFQLSKHLRAKNCFPPTKAKPAFRVLSFPRNAANRYKISLTEEIFEEIVQMWTIHEFSAEAFAYNNGTFAALDSEQYLSIFVKVPNSKPIGFDSVSVTHNRANGVIFVLFHGLEDEAAVFSRLESQLEFCRHPFFFAAVLYSSHQQHLERYHLFVNNALLKTERETGFGGPGMLAGHFIPPKESKGEIDYENVVKQLSYCQTEIAIIGQVGRFSIAYGNWLADTLQSKDWAAETIGDTVINEKLLHEAAFSRTKALGLVSQVQHLKDRVQSQTTLMLSLITQNEARYSAAIAVDSRRDSTSMKTIAVLTTLFLPGTFVATFFGMTMFDWSPDTGAAPRMSSYMWLYWAITLPLTLLVMVLWLFWARREQSKAELRLGRRSTTLSDETLEKMPC